MHEQYSVISEEELSGCAYEVNSALIITSFC